MEVGPVDGEGIALQNKSHAFAQGTPESLAPCQGEKEAMGPEKLGETCLAG